jgi:cytochrome P450
MAGVGRMLEQDYDKIDEAIWECSRVDLIADYAVPLVRDGILLAMGVPPERRPKIGELAHLMLGLLDPEQPIAERRTSARAAFHAAMIFERDGRAGRASGLHAALETAAETGEIPAKLARTTPVVVLHGGYENPLNHLACLMAWATADPDRFRHDALRSPGALVDEVVRVFSPARRVARWAATDVEIDGVVFQRGQLVWIDLETANSAGGAAASGEQHSSSRRPHLGFGYGRHACPGAALARLEGHVLVRALMRVPADVLANATVDWHESFVTRGPTRILPAPGPTTGSSCTSV